MKRKTKLTKSEVDKLPLPDNGTRYDVFDSELTGFGVRVSQTSKIYFLLKRVNSKLTRVTIGKHGVLTADQARKEAVIKLGDMAKGIDPNKEKARLRIQGVTLGVALDDYLEDRDLKESTKAFYRMMVDVHLKAWKNTQLRHITETDVKAKHKQLSKDIGKATANNVMKSLRAIYNHARAESKGDLPENPVNVLAAKKTWNKIAPRKSHIKNHELELWYRCVRELDTPITADFLLFTLFNGLRKNEALKLKWRDVDFKDRTFTIRNPKNHQDHTLPFSSFTEQLLLRRKSLRENDYIFPGIGESGHLVEPRRQLKAISAKSAEVRRQEPDAAMNESEGISTTVHDLRRSFTNIAEELASYSVLKRLLNHTPAKDVTADYLSISVEKLRAPMQEIADTMMIHMRAWSDYAPTIQPEGVINLAVKRRQRRDLLSLEGVDMRKTSQF